MALQTSQQRMPLWKRLLYIQPLDLVEEEDEYMQMVPERRVPFVQIILSVVSLFLVVAALIVDEMSDGDVKIYKQKEYYSLKDIDFDCGWNSFYLRYKYDTGYEKSDTHYYNRKSCEDTFEKEYHITNFCSVMEYAGKIWLVFGILGLVTTTAGMVAVFVRGKASIAYFLLNALSLIFWITAVAYWIDKEKCHELEDLTSDATELKTSIGVSQILIFVGITTEIISLLVSSLFLIRRHRLPDPVQFGDVHSPPSDRL